jgi:hypothetical protein
MKMRSILNYLLILSVVLIIACVPTLSLSDVSNLRKGMNPAKAEEISTIEPEYMFNFKNSQTNEDNILVHVYELTSGTYDSNYFYMFINNELHFWGYPHEYARSSDTLINEIGKLTVKKIEELGEDK